VTRAVVTLVVLVALVAGTGAVIVALGYSGTSAVLGMTLAAALCWTPALLALEHITLHRRNHDG
jgi:hypothetical protein